MLGCGSHQILMFCSEVDDLCANAINQGIIMSGFEEFLLLLLYLLVDFCDGIRNSAIKNGFDILLQSWYDIRFSRLGIVNRCEDRSMQVFLSQRSGRTVNSTVLLQNSANASPYR